MKYILPWTWLLVILFGAISCNNKPADMKVLTTRLVFKGGRTTIPFLVPVTEGTVCKLPRGVFTGILVDNIWVDGSPAIREPSPIFERYPPQVIAVTNAYLYLADAGPSPLLEWTNTTYFVFDCSGISTWTNRDDMTRSYRIPYAATSIVVKYRVQFEGGRLGDLLTTTMVRE